MNLGTLISSSIDGVLYLGFTLLLAVKFFKTVKYLDHPKLLYSLLFDGTLFFAMLSNTLSIQITLFNHIS
jgi:hypothetical protein